MNTERVLLIGYGNPGRLDDGLGPAAAAAVEAMDLPSVTVDSDYQLTVEDAEAAARHDVAIFVDAAEAGPEPFAVMKLTPSDELSFSTHSVRPEAVMGIVHKLFKGTTTGYLLGIRGYQFNEFAERLSERARANLAEAVGLLQHVLQSGDVGTIKAELDQRSTPTAPATGDDRCRTAST